MGLKGFTEAIKGAGEGLKEIRQQATPFAQTLNKLGNKIGVEVLTETAEKRTASEQRPDKKLADKIRNIKKLRQDAKEKEQIDEVIKKVKEEKGDNTSSAPTPPASDTTI